MDDKNRQLYSKFDSLIASHRNLIDRLCMRHAFGDVERCAELRQDCYISLWRYLPTLRENASSFHERAWVAWHCRSVFSHLRYRRRFHKFLPLGDNVADVLSENEQNKLRETIENLSTQLTPHERQAFYLMADGYSAEELAKEMGIKHRSAVLLRHRIISKLRQNSNSNDINVEKQKEQP